MAEAAEQRPGRKRRSGYPGSESLEKQAGFMGRKDRAAAAGGSVKEYAGVLGTEERSKYRGLVRGRNRKAGAPPRHDAQLPVSVDAGQCGPGSDWRKGRAGNQDRRRGSGEILGRRRDTGYVLPAVPVVYGRHRIRPLVHRGPDRRQRSALGRGGTEPGTDRHPDPGRPEILGHGTEQDGAGTGRKQERR